MLLELTCLILLWIREVWGDVRKQNLKNHLIPAIITYKDKPQVGGCVSSNSFQSFHGWCEMKYSLSYQQTKLYLSIILASPNMNFWAALVSCWREAGQCTICHTEDSRTSHSFTGRMARLYPWGRPLSFLLLSHLVMSTFCKPMNYGMPGHPVPR